MSRNTRSGDLALGHRRGLPAPEPASEHFVAVVLENHPHRVADRGLVVDDEDARFHGRQSGTIVQMTRWLGAAVVDEQRHGVARPERGDDGAELAPAMSRGGG